MNSARYVGFLSRFGQLLELHLGGETLYFFNCTNLIDCIDEQRTERGEEVIEQWARHAGLTAWKSSRSIRLEEQLE